MYATPRADLIEYHQDSKLWFFKNAYISSTTIHANSSRSHTVNAEAVHGIYRQTGTAIDVMSGMINYSDDGRWLLAGSSGVGFFRYNLETQQIISFGPTDLRHAGYVPQYKLSISPSGRYVVAVNIHSATATSIKVYDLENCVNPEGPHAISQSNNCASRDLYPFVSTQIPSFNRITMANFVDEDHIMFYHYNSGSMTDRTQYTLTAPGVGENTDIKYMALGDSFSSGEGARDYVVGTDVEENKCHLSTKSYPYRINAYLNPASFHSVACSGATINNVMGGGGFSMDGNDLYRDNQYDPADMDNMTTGLPRAWMPGFYAQSSKVSQGKPNALTVTMSGNNIGFGDMVATCVQEGNCYSTYTKRHAVAKTINSVYYRMVTAFKTIKKRAAHNAKVYAVGYPLLADPTGNCGSNVWMSATELEFANLVTQRLNLVVKQAADYAGVRYVDVEDALNGYRLCESPTPAVNGMTYGQEASHLIGSESFHPNALGHTLLRDAIMTETASFTQVMPSPDLTKTLPVINDSIPLLATVPVGAPYNYLPSPNQPMAPNLMFRDATYSIDVQGSNFNLDTKKTYSVELHSDPIALGAAQPSADDGNFSLDITIPDTVEPGFHTIHVFGQDMDNQPIDIYKTVYIAGSETDYDGDGLDDAPGECVLVPNSGVDVDEDGIDDACDPLIGDGDEDEGEGEGSTGGQLQATFAPPTAPQARYGREEQDLLAWA